MSIRSIAPSIESSLLLCILTLGATRVGPPSATELSKTYAAAVERLNEAHAKRPAGEDEVALAKKLPRDAVQVLEALLVSDGKDAGEALVRCGEAALDLDRLDDFEKIRARIHRFAPSYADKLGIAITRPRYLMRGLDGVEREGLDAIAGALDLVLAAYDDVFGFAEWSKVPGKKLRIRVHLVPKIERPPHFAPEFPWHSEVDFPVIDPKKFESPTKEGQFLLYGLCHEFGHVIAMWGDTKNEEDHHSWAHYTGIVIVDYLAEHQKDAPALEDLKDARWRSIEIEQQRLTEAQAKPGRGDKDACLALWLKLHDTVGPKAIGEAINALDKEDKRLRVNRVRYYGFDAFGRALLATSAGAKNAKVLGGLFP